jgi:hypothetical protein
MNLAQNVLGFISVNKWTIAAPFAVLALIIHFIWNKKCGNSFSANSFLAATSMAGAIGGILVSIGSLFSMYLKNACEVVPNEIFAFSSIAGAFGACYCSDKVYHYFKDLSPGSKSDIQGVIVEAKKSRFKQGQNKAQ